MRVIFFFLPIANACSTRLFAVGAWLTLVERLVDGLIRSLVRDYDFALEIKKLKADDQETDFVTITRKGRTSLSDMRFTGNHALAKPSSKPSC